MRYFACMTLLAMGAVAPGSPARADHARYGPILTIDAEDARALMARGGVASIDLRPEADLPAGRLPGYAVATACDARLAHRRVTARRSDRPYGDGPNEQLFGTHHFIRARRAGEVYVLDGGIDGWRRLGYPLER